MEVTSGSLGIREYLHEVRRLLDVLPTQIEPFIEALYQAYVEDRAIFLVGNGGSAANASHFGQDLSKSALPNLSVTKRFRAIALTNNVPLITALANDEGYESVFVQQLIALGRSGDVLIAISGSGNSPNVLRAVEYANECGMRTIGVTGFSGGKLGKIAQINVNVPSTDFGLVEAIHSVLFHLTVSQLSQRIVRQFKEAQ